VDSFFHFLPIRGRRPGRPDEFKKKIAQKIAQAISTRNFHREPTFAT
jgi:hypothetical protein